MTDLTPGTTVRILVSAGLVEHEEDSKFVAVVPAGTLGVYDRPRSSRPMDDWHLVMVDHPDFRYVLYAPLHLSQMEVAE